MATATPLDGRLLVVSGRETLLLHSEPDGSLVLHVNLRGLLDRGWTEIVVDGRGSVYINQPGAYIAHAAAQRFD